MKYAALIYTDTQSPTADAAEAAAITAEYEAISSEDRVVGGAHLQDPDTATTVRVADGETLLTEGPFVDAKEYLGGFFLIEAPDLDTAIELAARVPAARSGGAVEVRPLVER
jgi:hypothetical protein